MYALLRSLRRLKNTLNAINPIAMIKAATAATVSPAIWAGVIFGRSSFATGAAIEVGVDDDVEVADAGSDIESTKTDWLEESCVCSVVLVMDVIVAREIEAVEEAGIRDVAFDVLDAREVLLGTTVRAVFVGRTAFFCPKQTLYAEAAASMLEQEAYTQPSATSPSDSPMVLYREHRHSISPWAVHATGKRCDNEVRIHECAQEGMSC